MSWPYNKLRLASTPPLTKEVLALLKVGQWMLWKAPHLYLISMYSQSHVEIEIFLLTSPLLFAYFLLFFAFPCRWRAWPATIAPTLWSLSGICRWSSRSDITVIAGSRPLRLRAIWRKCWPSLQRPKLWRETSTPVTSVTVSETSRTVFFTLISRYLQFPPIKHAEKKRRYKLNDN